MWPESGEAPQPLRTGLTTGTCATACSVAAAKLLLAQQQCDQVSVTLPKGKVVELAIHDVAGDGVLAHAATIKDAGDDPDVTHGARIWVKLSLTEQLGCTFAAGAGVGIVTRVGLVIPPQEPAINPVPRQMIAANLQNLAERYGYQGGFVVQVGVDQGEKLAKKTMNGRLGIVGGLSILGTSGIVRPYSCAAWIASIHQGLDVAHANGCDQVAASTGNTSEAYVKQHYQLADMQLIEMGDFAGAVLKHLRKSPVAKVILCGGFGKLTKLANGHLDLHSSRSAIDFVHLAELAARAGASAKLCAAITQANTSLEGLQLCLDQGIDLATTVCQEAKLQAQKYLPNGIHCKVIAVNRQGQCLGQTA